MTPLTFWGRMKSNLYWGKRRGMTYKDGTPAFKIKRYGGTKSNSGPVGWKAKRARRGLI